MSTYNPQIGDMVTWWHGNNKSCGTVEGIENGVAYIDLFIPNQCAKVKIGDLESLTDDK